MTKKFSALLISAAVLLASVNLLGTKAYAAESNIISTTVDSRYFKTVSSNGSTWYVTDGGPSLSFEGTSDVHLTTGGKSVGLYSYHAGKYDYVYHRPAILDLNTGKITLIDEEFDEISAYCDDYNIFIASCIRDQEYMPDGKKNSNLRTYAYFTYDGRRLTDIDYTYVTSFYNGYALVGYYRNYEQCYEIIDSNGKSVRKLEISSIGNRAQNAYLLVKNEKNESCYVDIAHGGNILSKDTIGDFDSHTGGVVPYTLYNLDAFNTFVKNQAADWQEYTYLGKDYFAVKGADKKFRIVNSKGKVILASDSEGDVVEPGNIYYYNCPTAFYIDDRIYFSKCRENPDSAIYINNMYSVYDESGKQIIGYKNRYATIAAADSGFLCCYDVTTQYRYMGQHIVDTAGNVIKELPWNRGTLFTYYEGDIVDPGHNYYDESAIPADQTFVISDRYKGITNTLKSDILDRKIGEDLKESIDVFFNEYQMELYPNKNAIAKLYVSFMEKQGAPAFQLWNMFLTISSTPVSKSNKAAPGAINVNDKGEKIDYLAVYKAHKVELTSVTNDVKSDVDLAWNAVDGASKYVIQYQKQASGSYNGIATVEVEVKDAAATTIDTGNFGKHRFRVQAFSSKGIPVSPLSEWEEINIIRDKAAVAAKNPMTYFTSIVSDKAKTVTLTWNPIPNAKTYKIGIKRATTSGDGDTKTVTDATSYTCTVKYPGQDYVFRIMALDSKSNIILKWTNWTAGTHVMTEDEANGTAKTPGFTSMESKKANSVSLSWPQVKGAASYQIASKRSTISGDGSITKVDGSKTSYELSCKFNDVYYVFRIRALDKNGKPLKEWSDWSEKVYIMK